MSPICEQRWGQITLPLLAQSVAVCAVHPVVFSCIRSHSTCECYEAFSTYLSTPLHALPTVRPSPIFQTLPKIRK